MRLVLAAVIGSVVGSAMGPTMGGAMDGAALGALTRPLIAPAAPRATPHAAPGTTDTVLVARRPLARGVALTAADIDTLFADRRHAPGGERSSARPTVGWITRRVVRAGEPLRPPAVAPPPLVAAGATVTLVWDTGTVRLTRLGTAMADALEGESVVVRVDAKRRFTGTATAPGTVTMRAP